ncbi:NAD(P)H nitroreductase [Vibrio sp.]|uniref:Putative NAD(P)H nitroreductase n=1 Tax=Vibrio viridaestus TaxID=2487322 RepID=A0A3N9TFX3_9VIBR|nr:NAD(P)H nitroreductase [Vibrio viridaestus]MDC0611517.1 NAD(P)H nitroreductase [Vibrio sp.]RQW63158.1 NAD(P)H nitroreductase [Vibrio viridaestus]
MEALDLLLNRRSMARLEAPAPDGTALENILRAGMRAPDHGNLTPWEFVIAEGKGLEKLSSILTKAVESENGDEATLTKVKNAPFRAPMVITVIARVTPHEKVPALEQVLSAGCAVQAMQMAAVAQGYQGIWRSGKWMFHSVVREAFNVYGDDEIVGFLYLGKPGIKPMKAPERAMSEFVKYI